MVEKPEINQVVTPQYVMIDKGPSGLELIPQRLVRKEEGGIVFIADNMNLSPAQLEQALSIAGGMNDLEDPEKTFEWYLNQRKREGKKDTVSATWVTIAMEIRDEYLRTLGEDVSTLPPPVADEIETAIGTVAVGLDSYGGYTSFHATYSLTDGRKAQSVCQGQEIAKKWISAGKAAIEKARAEHPELF